MLAVVVIAAVFVAAVVIVGLLWQAGDGRLRRGSNERIRAGDVLLGDEAFGARATMLLFTSPIDPRGGAVRDLLHRIAGGTPGARVAEVDLGAHGDLAGRYAVLRTPTTFVLDGHGRLRARLVGVPTTADVVTALAATADERTERISPS